MGIPLHSKLRRNVRNFINKLLIMFVKNESNQQPIDTTQVTRILIIRINYRIGNIIFLTPLINALAKKMPHAKIDVLIGAKYIIPILTPMNNVDNVYDVPRKLLRNPIQLFNMIKKINANHYDLLISPVVSSGSANVSTLLIKAKNKLGFHRQNIWSAANITVPYPEKTLHEALKPLSLMAAFEERGKVSYSALLDINLSVQEKVNGNKILFELLKNNNITIENPSIIGVFRDARHDKKIEDIWWQPFIEQLLAKDPNLVIIDIIAPNTTRLLSENTLSISFENLRELACFMFALDSFICADTGPMHLASAAKVPVIAFFNVTSADHYGPLGEFDRVINVRDVSVTEAVNATQLCFQEVKRKIAHGTDKHTAQTGKIV
jgi:lipopolysaccharide heptosyltransferase III